MRTRGNSPVRDALTLETSPGPVASPYDTYTSNPLTHIVVCARIYIHIVVVGEELCASALSIDIVAGDALSMQTHIYTQ